MWWNENTLRTKIYKQSKRKADIIGTRLLATEIKSGILCFLKLHRKTEKDKEKEK